jgi:hypothetical protein
MCDIEEVESEEEEYVVVLNDDKILLEGGRSSQAFSVCLNALRRHDTIPRPMCRRDGGHVPYGRTFLSRSLWIVVVLSRSSFGSSLTGPFPR